MFPVYTYFSSSLHKEVFFSHTSIPTSKSHLHTNIPILSTLCIYPKSSSANPNPNGQPLPPYPTTHPEAHLHRTLHAQYTATTTSQATPTPKARTIAVPWRSRRRIGAEVEDSMQEDILGVEMAEGAEGEVMAEVVVVVVIE